MKMQFSTSKAIWAFAAVILVFYAACRSKKVVTKLPEVKPDTVVNAVKKPIPKPDKILFFTQNNWTSFSSKISIDYESETHSLPINSFGGQLKMKKDEYIWMSIQVPFLGEAARAIITKDSLKVIDRYNKRYLMTKFSYLQKFSSVPLSLEKLQAALIGNPTFELKDAQIDTAESMMVAIFQDAKIKNTIFAMLNSLRVQKNIYIDKLQNVDITAVYNEFETIENQMIPKKIHFSTTKPEKNDADLEYSNIILNKPITSDFNIPSGYKTWNEK